MVAVSSYAQQGPPPGPPPSPQLRLEQIMSKLEKDISLKSDQKQQVQNAYRAFFESVEKLRAAQPEPPPPHMPPGKKEDMDKLVKARDERIRKALNPVQFKKYLEIEKTMRPSHGRPGGPPPPRN